MNSNYQKVGKILNMMLKFFIILGGIFIIGYYELLKSQNIDLSFFNSLFYPLGISFLYLVYQFTLMFQTLVNKNPFIKENISRLNNASISSFIISIIIFISILLTIFVYKYNVFLLMTQIFFFILFIGVTIALYILKELFKEAIYYKQENDLTI